LPKSDLAGIGQISGNGYGPGPVATPADHGDVSVDLNRRSEKHARRVIDLQILESLIRRTGQFIDTVCGVVPFSITCVPVVGNGRSRY
jgi:hypothetical protein